MARACHNARPEPAEKLETAARDAGVLERIELHALDVTNAEQIATMADLVARRGEPLHALVNNAGFAMPGFAEDVTDAELREQFDTNFFGTVAVTRACCRRCDARDSATS